MRLLVVISILLLSTVARADIPAPVCYGPGACFDGYHAANNLQFNFVSTLIGPYVWGPNIPVGWHTGIVHNIYIAFEDDSVTPWTTTQQQIIVEYFSHIMSSTWGLSLLSEYPQSTDRGSGVTKSDTYQLINCLTGSPAHCFHETYTAGANIDDRCPILANAAGISETYGVCVTLYSQPNTNGTSFNACPTVGTWNGVSVFAGQTLHSSPVDRCSLNGATFADATTPIATAPNFTQPAPGTFVGVTFSSTFSTHFIYIPGFGFYNVNPLLDCAFSTFCQIAPNNHPINAVAGTTVSGNVLLGSAISFPPNWQNSVAFCYFDQALRLATAEFASAIINASGPGCSSWGQTVGSPPRINGYTLHDVCGSGSFVSPSDGGLISPASSFIVSNFGFVDSTFVLNQRYDFMLPSIRRVEQTNYCSAYPIANYFGVTCKQNSDCPASSGVCSGTAYGSFCVPPTCSDHIKNGNETGVDCGGGAASNAPFSNNCGPCFAGGGSNCTGNQDCSGEDGVSELCIAGACTAM